MTLLDLLKEFFPVNECKKRFANKQIKINGEICTALDHDLQIQDGYWELGDFIYHNMSDDFSKRIDKFKKLSGNTIQQMFDYDYFLDGFLCVSFSKREHYVFILSQVPRH
jgi:hypothetical protein